MDFSLKELRALPVQPPAKFFVHPIKLFLRKLFSFSASARAMKQRDFLTAVKFAVCTQLSTRCCTSTKFMKVRLTFSIWTFEPEEKVTMNSSAVQLKKIM